MRGKGGAVLGIIVIVFGFILFGALLTSVDSWAYTDASTSRTVTTGAGVTTGNITLGNPLYNANLDNISELTSTLDTDDPAPSAYDEDNDVFTVSGLTQSESRTIAVTYLTERTDSYLATFSPYLPFFVLLMFLAAGGGLIYKSFR